MAGDVDVKLHGGRELGSGTERLAGEIAEAAGAAFLGVAEKAASATRMRVPHRSGTLAGSVEAGHEEDGASVGMGAGVPYAGWIEFGGSRGRPYVSSGRYLYPTATGAEPALAAAGNEAARKEIGGFRWASPSV